ncbi:DUF3558 domain-containing protein [Nocardia gipuzkoensis]|uniref:DUF3558 domain-containing protein n=1 Tax=Nocardia gipuzkoensis TaxID=2749991 RepID=UPI00237D5816|nr:DUF3558 domain-containing protein [Nocardia gipuzkoensis]MDE1670164.1 DUF3558 domain-containing protein [Nocardia gipuzkoensis]
MRYGTGGEEPMTSWGKVLRGAALAVGATLVVVGCGDSTDSPSATTTTAVAAPSSSASKSADPDAALWDPCTLPDSAISGAGLNQATKEKDVAGVDFTGWKVCGWQASARWYDLGVLSGAFALDEVRQRQDKESFTPLTVGSHRALQYLDVGDSKRLKCSVAVENAHGTVIFKVTTRYSIGKQGEPCQEAGRHADDLVRYLPTN